MSWIEGLTSGLRGERAGLHGLEAATELTSHFHPSTIVSESTHIRPTSAAVHLESEVGVEAVEAAAKAKVPVHTKGKPSFHKNRFEDLGRGGERLLGAAPAVAAGVVGVYGGLKAVDRLDKSALALTNGVSDGITALGESVHAALTEFEQALLKLGHKSWDLSGNAFDKAGDKLAAAESRVEALAGSAVGPALTIGTVLLVGVGAYQAYRMYVSN